jgi:hypothetical protein
MIDVRKHVVSLIKQATGLECYYVYPPKKADLPCVVYNEVANDDYILALNNEYANISYNLTVYTKDPSKIFDVVNKIDKVMREYGFTKDYTSPDMYSEDTYSKTLRFRAIINDKYETFLK